MGYIRFTVPGIPATQGSKRPLKNGIMIEANKRLPAWRTAVTDRAFAARYGKPTMTGAIALGVTFIFPRPKSHYRSNGQLKDNAPYWVSSIGRNDLDKLLRAICDGITDAKVWRDDGQVAHLSEINKIYGEFPCAEIEIETLSEVSR